MSIMYADLYALYDKFCRKYYDFQNAEWVHPVNERCVRKTPAELWEDFSGYSSEDIMVVQTSLGIIDMYKRRERFKELQAKKGVEPHVGED